MRLLQLQDDVEFSLVQFSGNNIPAYAILSHTWGPENEEANFEDIQNKNGRFKPGFSKLRFCAKEAERDGLQHFWIDTCCIDKSSSQELTENINSMFRFYKDAKKCYVYLSDVSNCSSDIEDNGIRRWKPEFRKSRWFTRGWTLQELIAPSSVEFFSREGTNLGNKQSLEQTLYEITGIAVEALRGAPLSTFSVEERFSWAKERATTREEDAAYCLLGIFDIQMPLLYAEGQEKALRRLKKEIKEHSNYPDYLDWLDEDEFHKHHGFLWVKGKPGAGKSTLMRFALAHIRKTRKDQIVLSFFFNARGDDIEKSTVGTYRCLLFQLLERLPALQCIFDELDILGFCSSTNPQWSVESLKIMLERAIMLLDQSSVVCFIDALDECDEEQIREMVLFFEHMGDLAMNAGIGFRVCFSSRHYPYITIKNALGLVLEGQEGHTQDITNYLESELKIGQSKIAQQIRTELQGKASGVFMWVALVVGILNKEHDRGRIHALRRKLDEIPGDLHELFRDILTRDSQDKDELLLCIQWVLFARQPLNPKQLYFAILSGTEPDTVSAWDHENITEDVIHRFIVDSSKGLAEVTASESCKVQFIHETVRDFLLKDDGLGKIWPDLQSNLRGQSHERLKQCCHTHMKANLSVHLTGFEELPRVSSQEAAALRRSTTYMFPFLEYAVHNILYHADAAEGYGVSQEALLAEFELSRWLYLDNLFEEQEMCRRTPMASLEYILGERNLPNLIKASPLSYSCLKVGVERYGPPLLAAIATGSDEAVQAFTEILQRSQRTENGSYEVRSHHRKDQRGCDKIGRRFHFSKRGNILSYLVEYGYETIFALALGPCEDQINGSDSYNRMPLFVAIENQKESMAKLLLASGKVSFKRRNYKNQTAVLAAVMVGNLAIVELVLGACKTEVDQEKRKAQNPTTKFENFPAQTDNFNINEQDRQGRTVLHWAVANGFQPIAELLSNMDVVDVNAKDQFSQTPISLALHHGHEGITKVLIDTGKFDLNSTNLHGYTPLILAARGGHRAIVQLLLNTGQIDINAKGAFGWSPLSFAIENGLTDIVKLMREHEDRSLLPSSGRA